MMGNSVSCDLKAFKCRIRRLTIITSRIYTIKLIKDFTLTVNEKQYL